MVEILMSVVGEVAAKVTGCLLDPITSQFGYLLNYRRNITDLNQQIQSLHLEKERLQIDVDAANRQGDEIYPHVQAWLTYAEGIIQNRDDFDKDEKKASHSCFYFKSRHRLSKRAKRDAEEIAAKINEARHFGDRVYYRPPPTSVLPLISSASFKDYEAFESREPTFNQIMEALRNEDVRVIGVWGMGGVGKTTLVKQVAKQAEEEKKLFHKVVIVLDITEKPNISEIQGRIASQFGSKLEAAENRAARLRQMFKKVEKILVILDDIWGKLDLGKIGIPHDGDDHKGCKVLLTSRKLPVLTKDMGTQKQFHLQHLSEAEAWALFTKIACDSEESFELPRVAVDVAKECAGLPVAIVTVAKALSGERDDAVWRNALEELRTCTPVNIGEVNEKVYSCLQLSYNHLKSDEAKSLFLLCSLVGDGDISMESLLQYAMGLNLFKGLYSWEKAADRLIALVNNLKVSSLLLDNRVYERSLFFEEAFVRMHDVVRDVARSIASKDPHPFVVKEAGELREWQRTNECRNCSRISLMSKNMDELALRLVCPQLQFFLLNSSHVYENRYLNIPDDFFQHTKQMRVLDLCGASLAPSPSSLGLLSNLQTLCLNKCKLQDIVAIGGLTRLQVLSLAKSNIKELPVEMRNLSDLRVLDLRYCSSLEVVPRYVLSSLSQLEYLSMEGSFKEWEAEGFSSGEGISQMNARVSELKHLSGLRTLEISVPESSMLPEDDVVFDNIKNLTRYSMVIGRFRTHFGQYNASRLLDLYGAESLQMVKSFPNLLRRSQVLHLEELKDTKHVVNELDKDGFVDLKYLDIWKCPKIQYILDSTSAEWSPPHDTFAMLEKLEVMGLDKLEAVCHGPIPMASFRNLRILELVLCRSLKYVFSRPENERELDFPQLQSLSLDDLISFCSTGSNGSQESVAFFNQKVAFPALEILKVSSLYEARTLSHHQLPADSFFKLKNLEVSWCDKLLNVLPLSLAKALVQLEELKIEYCDEVVEAIVANENGDEDEDEDETTPLFLFPKLTSLVLRRLPQLKKFCSKRCTSGWPLLKTLEVSHCDKVEILFQEMCLEDEIDTQIQQPLFFVEKVYFPSLEFLTIESLGNVKELWHNQLLGDSFPKLKELKIHSCKNLSNIFPSNIVEGFQSLQILEIDHCEALEEIFYSKRVNGKEIDGIPDTLCFKKGIQGLPIFQNLRSIRINDCPFLKHVFPVFVARALVQLKRLVIRLCEVETIVANEDESVPSFLFPMLTSLKLESLPQLKQNCLGRFTSRWPLLKDLKVLNCDKVEILFQEMGLEDDDDDKVQLPLFLVEKESFLSLELLRIEGLCNVKALWHIQLADSFSKLKELKIRSCNKLSKIFPSNILKGLQSLQILEISNCDALEEIFEIKEINGKDMDGISGTPSLFPKLTSLKLDTLPKLNKNCLGRFISRCPLLNDLKVLNCDKVEILFQEMGLEDNRDEKIQHPPFLVEKVSFHRLELLKIEDLSNVNALGHNQLLAKSNSFSKLKELKICSCNKLLNIFPSNILIGLQSLQILEIMNCDALEEIFDLKGINGKEIDGIPGTLSFNKDLREHPIFQNLQSIKVSGCPHLKYAFPVSVAKTLVRLDHLQIEFCGVETIVANEDEAAPLFLFPKLTSLKFESLPQLKQNCLGRFTSRWPLLKELEVCDCDKVGIVFQEIGLEADLDDKIQQSLFLVEKGSFPNLKRLILRGTMEIWRGPFSSMSFSKLEVLRISKHHGISIVISSSIVQRLHNLEELHVFNSVNEIIQVERLPIEEFHAQALPRLTEICLRDLPKLMHLSGLDPCFQNLQTLEVVQCESLINLVAPSTAKRLVQLRKLIIRNCNNVKEIVGNEGGEPTDDDDEIEFTTLKSVLLCDLPNLKSFCSTRYTFRFPSLEEIYVDRCYKMECFCNGVLSTPRLMHEGINYDLKAYWKNDLNTTIHKMFTDQNALDYEDEDSKKLDYDY